jgi:hypothetical protein
MKATRKRIQTVEPIDGWHVLHLADGTALGVRTDRAPRAGAAVVIVSIGPDDDTLAVLEHVDGADGDGPVTVIDTWAEAWLDAERRRGADEAREALKAELELERRRGSWRGVLDDLRRRVAATIAPRG